MHCFQWSPGRGRRDIPGNIPLPIRADGAESHVIQSARRTGAVEAAWCFSPLLATPSPPFHLPFTHPGNVKGLGNVQTPGRSNALLIKQQADIRASQPCLGKCAEQKEPKGQLEIFKENKQQDKNGNFKNYSMVQFSSVAQSCPTLCDPMNFNTPGLPVYHQLPEFMQAHVYRVGNAIQSSHPL